MSKLNAGALKMSKLNAAIDRWRNKQIPIPSRAVAKNQLA